jgi:hypothetical protein
MEPRRLNFTESEFAFGCDGDRNLDTKSFAFEFFSSFIDRGKKVASPDDDQDHYRQPRDISNPSGRSHAPPRRHLILVTSGTIRCCWFVLPILRWYPGLAWMIDRFEVEASEQRLQLYRLELSQIFGP